MVLFLQYLNQRKKFEAEEKRVKQRKARDDFLAMLEVRYFHYSKFSFLLLYCVSECLVFFIQECKELTSLTRWRYTSNSSILFVYSIQARLCFLFLKFHQIIGVSI